MAAQLSSETAFMPQLTNRWQALQQKLCALLQHPSISTEGMLFLIGLRELGLGPDAFSKEEKYNIIHVGMSAVLTYGGYYRLTHHDSEGWPHFQLVQPLPLMDAFAQASFMQQQLLAYFSRIYPEL